MGEVGIIDIFGVFAGLLGTISFVKSNLPAQPQSGGSVLRVAIGSHSDLSAAGGYPPSVNAYNEEMVFIGQYAGGATFNPSGDQIAEGGFMDLLVAPAGQGNTAGEQPTYVQLNVGNDALCIAYLSHTWADGTQRGWLGDMGQACGQSWYYSDVIVGSNSHKPDCIWLDNDHTNNIISTSMQIHIQEFANISTSYNQDPNHYCSAPTLDFHQSDDLSRTEEFWRDGLKKSKRFSSGSTAVGPHMRRSRQAAKAKRNELVVTSYAKHTATRICGDKNSVGPDLVSTDEGMFCDMENKKLFPLCAKATDTDCFDQGSSQLKTESRKRAVKYNRIMRWGS